jgi:hypothetical protein
MSQKIELTQLSEQELKTVRGLPPVREIETKFSKKELRAADARAALKKWQEEQSIPAAPKNPEITVAAVEPTPAALSKLAAVMESESGPAEVLSQKLDEATLTGTIYTAFITHQYMRLEAEHRRKLASPRTRPAAEREWPEVVKAYQKAFAVAGIRNVDEARLSRFAKDLAANRRNLDAVTKLVNSAKAVGAQSDTVPTVLRATFVPVTARIIDPNVVTTFIPNLCAQPLAQGTFTRHFAYSFNWTVSFGAPCIPKFWKWCNYTLTIAGVSFNAGLNVNYKVECCKVTASGQGFAQACGTILNKTFCASCSATLISGVSASKTTVGGNCNYSLGLTASLACKFGSSTLFSASAPFKHTVTGGCPPAILNC